MRPWTEEDEKEYRDNEAYMERLEKEAEKERLAKLPKCCNKPMRKVCTVPVSYNLNTSFELWQCQGNCKQVREDEQKL